MPGGRRSTTWKKGTNPPGRKKGAKGKKTLLKEAIGLQGWEALQKFIETEGSDKMITEMKKLQKGSFVFAFKEMAEFFKPRLARTEVTGKDGNPEIPVKITLNLGK